MNFKDDCSKYEKNQVYLWKYRLYIAVTWNVCKVSPAHAQPTSLAVTELASSIVCLLRVAIEIRGH